MLRLVRDRKKKKAAQAALDGLVRGTLPPQGIRNIGFKGGNRDRELFSQGEGRLWASIAASPEKAKIPRYWNTFGIFAPDRAIQNITVEVNVPSASDSRMVAGFFAEDDATGDVYLMHDGSVGGGRKGIGREAFLVWSNARMIEAVGDDGQARMGIPIGSMADPNFSGRLEKFVGKVASFKEAAAGGKLETPAFRRRLAEFDRYRREFSGRKSGSNGGSLEYVSYHGDVVDLLYEERTAAAATGEKVFNSQLVDLFVKKGGRLVEIYEVKTGLGRQTLYTAIGQLMTHSAEDPDIAKVLVLPIEEAVPGDISRAVESLGIKLRRFGIDEAGARLV